MSITINIKNDKIDKDIVIPVEWKDISVKYWGELSSIIKKHYSAAEEEKKKKKSKEHKLLKEEGLEGLMSVKDLNPAQTVKLNRDIFSYMTGLDIEEVKNVDLEQIEKVLSTINTLTEEYKPVGKNYFDLDGETYYFPSEFLKQNTYGDFIEATQLDMYIKDMENGRFDVLPEQMAILCRKDGEEFDEDAIPEKAEKFRKLTMDIVWEFSFFLTNQSKRLATLFPSFSKQQQQQQQEQE